MTKIFSSLTTALVLLAPNLPAQDQDAGQQDKFLLLATSRTGTMEKELNEVGARGYRFAGTQGGETAFGGNEVVVIMSLDSEGRRFRYLLLSNQPDQHHAKGDERGAPWVRVRRHDRVSIQVRRKRSRCHPRGRDQGRVTGGPEWSFSSRRFGSPRVPSD